MSEPGRRNNEYSHGKQGDGRNTPEKSWVDMEAIKDGETFFVNAVLEGVDVDNVKSKGGEVTEEEYNLWMERQESIRKMLLMSKQT